MIKTTLSERFSLHLKKLGGYRPLVFTFVLLLIGGDALAQRPGVQTTQPTQPTQTSNGRPGLQPTSGRPGLSGSSSRPGLSNNRVSSRPGIERDQRLGIQQVGEATTQVERIVVKRVVSGPEATVDEADKLVEKGDYSRAMELYQKALQAQPGLTSAFMGIGYAYLKQGEYEDALQQYQQVLERSPNNLEAKLNLGVALYRSGRIEESIKHYEQLVQDTKSASASTHFNLAVAYAHMGDFDNAIAQYNNAIKKRNNIYPEACNNLGLLYEVMGEGEKAALQYRQAIKQQKGPYALAHYNLGRHFHTKGDYQEALNEFQAAITQQKDFAEAYLDIGNIYLSRSVAYNTKELDKAAASYRKALELRKNLYPLAHENLAITLTKMGDKQAAIAEYQIAFDQLDGRCPETLQNLISTITNGEFFVINNELARSDIAGNLRTVKDTTALDQAIARLVKNLKKYEDLDDEEKAMAEVRYCAGLSFGALGNWSAAAEEFINAVKLSDKHKDARRALIAATTASLGWIVPRS